MRSTVVPAQVTTVEDRIAGSLGLSQLILLITPIFLGSLLYVILPPFFGYHVYKVVLLAILAVVCGLLAVRIKGQILLLWLLVILRYSHRPRYFVHRKNSLYGRNYEESPKSEPIVELKQGQVRPVRTAPVLTTAELVKVEDLLANPQANVRFTTSSKGGLRVHITSEG